MHFRITLFILFAVNAISFAQRQTIASQGGTYETTSKILVSQSIGQASVIGGFGSKNAQVIQGFQQPYWTGLISQNPLPLDITISPNPFVEEVMLSFDKDVLMRINLYDISGKLVYNQKVNYTGPYQYFNFSGLAVGAYLVVIKANGLSYFTKLLKE